ncbi:hypothetical protein VIGAN_11122300 [Vigna angularis var. angularis]|uniref:Uncharacterized protein n=1 Tax=Vigna angularis var. angularis TaxID=157739 RepID=A0A0S3T9M7_PHAAN|nr:hypothetical protein VIGAN_11122300 [Vigna angularis var. angularis]
MEHEVPREALAKEKEGKKVAGEKGYAGVRDLHMMVAPLRLPSYPPSIQFSSRKIKLARAYCGEPGKDFKTNLENLSSWRVKARRQSWSSKLRCSKLSESKLESLDVVCT